MVRTVTNAAAFHLMLILSQSPNPVVEGGTRVTISRSSFKLCPSPWIETPSSQGPAERFWPGGCRRDPHVHLGMELRTARLCLDCEEVHAEQQCPICASESFAYLTRWVPVGDRPQVRRPPAPPP